MKTWVKLYTEINRDPKMGTLSWAHRGIWSALLALAGELDHRDEQGQETGEIDTSDNAAWHIRCDLDEFSKAVEVFVSRGMVTEKDGVLYLTNYGERQRRAPSDAPERVRERAQRHRARLQDARNEDATPLHDESNDDVTSASRGVTRSDTDTDTDTEIETEKIQTQIQIVASAAADCRTPEADFVAESIRAYEDTIGLLSGTTQSEEIRDTLAELYAHNVGSWWNTALLIAADNNKRSWSYVRAILENHLREGTAPERKNGGVQVSPGPPQKRIVVVHDPETGERAVREVVT